MRKRLRYLEADAKDECFTVGARRVAELRESLRAIEVAVMDGMVATYPSTDIESNEEQRARLVEFYGWGGRDGDAGEPSE